MLSTHCYQLKIVAVCNPMVRGKKILLWIAIARQGAFGVGFVLLTSSMHKAVQGHLLRNVDLRLVFAALFAFVVAEWLGRLHEKRLSAILSATDS